MELLAGGAEEEDKNDLQKQFTQIFFPFPNSPRQTLTYEKHQTLEQSQRQSVEIKANARHLCQIAGCTVVDDCFVELFCCDCD